LNQLIIDVEDALEHYDPTTGGRKIEGFVNDLSNWYVRRSRRRFWKSQSDDDKMSAYYTLYRCLVVLSKLLAPFIPFVAEALYQNLVLSVDMEAVQSVHLAEFPVADRSLIDRKIDDATDLVMKVCSLGRAARAKAGVKVRQPLPKVLVRIKSETEQNYLARLDNQILDELNVKSIEYIENAVEDGTPGIIAVTEGDLWVAVNTELSPELKAEGIAREVVRRLQTMRRSAGLDITDSIIVYYSDENSLATVMEQFGDYIRQETLSRDLIAETPPVESYTEKHKLSGKEVIFGISKAAE
jgi:isoleucyl-tRNA synthetase